MTTNNLNYTSNMYSVYKITDIINELNKITEKSEEVNNFFKNFNFETIIKDNLAKTNSVYVFKNVIKEDTTKSKITQALNKLHQQNLVKIISMIREITFKNMDELNELVNQCIQKIKRDNEQIRPLVAALCYELLSTFFKSSTGELIYFRKLLLTSVKKDYLESLDFTNDNWTKEKCEKTMILIGTLYNSKILEINIMKQIVNDLKNLIKFKTDENELYYENVEKSIQSMSILVSIINLQEFENTNQEINNNIYYGLDDYLEKEMEQYENEKYRITKKVRLICKNIIQEIRKNNKN